MSNRNWGALAYCLFAACGTTSSGTGEPGSATIQVSPANALLTVNNGQAQTQAYSATLVLADGTTKDVTSEAKFAIASDAFGAFAGSTATVNGGAAGVTQVTASAEGATGQTDLTVKVHATRVEGAAPANADVLFGAATAAAANAPAVVYPADGVVAPPNLGQFDVHWTDTHNNLWAVELANEYADLTVYTTGQPGGSFWTFYTPAEWSQLATVQQELTLTVSGLDTASPSTKSSAATQHVGVTNEQMVGGVYYWTTSAPQGIYRYDMTNPSVAPAPYFSASTQPGGSGDCMGCHTLSRDGTKLALTLDGGNGRGTVVNVADSATLVPVTTNPQYWNFATFSADNTELVTVFNGALSLRQTNGGAVIASIPSSPGHTATHPELSPDGNTLVNVETTGAAVDWQAPNGAIVARSFDSSTNTFGSIKTLLANGTDGMASYYPSYSPDGQWLLLTRTVVGDNTSYQNPDSTVWVMKADGSTPAIKLASTDVTTGITDSWARWAPFGLTTGPNNEPLYFLTFSSARAFGVRLAADSIDNGNPQTQIWMAPFYPDRAIAGQDPSGPALRVPFQNVATSNHIAQWTQQVVVIQ